MYIICYVVYIRLIMGRPKKSEEKTSNVERCWKYKQINLEQCQKMESVKKKILRLNAANDQVKNN